MNFLDIFSVFMSLRSCFCPNCCENNIVGSKCLYLSRYQLAKFSRTQHQNKAIIETNDKYVRLLKSLMQV